MRKNLIKILFMCPMLSAPLVLGNYVHNNNTLRQSNNTLQKYTESFVFNGGWEQDRYYYLYFDAGTARKLLSLKNGFNYLDGGPGQYGTQFDDALNGNGASPGGSDGSGFLDLILGITSDVFTGTAPDGMYYSIFDYGSFTNDLKAVIASPTVERVELDFFLKNNKPGGTNLYGVHYAIP